MKKGFLMLMTASLICIALLAGCSPESPSSEVPAPGTGETDEEETYVMVPQFSMASPAGRGIDFGNDIAGFYWHQFAPEITGFRRLPSADVEAALDTEILGCAVKMTFRAEGKRQIFEGSFSDGSHDTQIYFRSDYDGKDSFDYVQKLVIENASMGGFEGGALYVVTVGKDISLDGSGNYHGEMKTFAMNQWRMFFMTDGEIHSEKDAAGIFLKAMVTFMPDAEDTKEMTDAFFKDTDITIEDLSAFTDFAAGAGEKAVEPNYTMFWRDGRGYHAVGNFDGATMPGFTHFNKAESGDGPNFHDTYMASDASKLFRAWPLVDTEETEIDGKPKFTGKWTFVPEEWKDILK